MIRYGKQWLAGGMVAASLMTVSLLAQTRAVTAPAPAPAAAADYFLKLDGVRGESAEKDHKEWIEVLSYSWGASNQRAVSRGAAGQAPSGPGTLTITKRIDKASPVLAKTCSSGRSPSDVVVHLPSGPGGGLTEYVLHGATVSGCNQAAPTESISFNFEKITTRAAQSTVQPARAPTSR